MKIGETALVTGAILALGVLDYVKGHDLSSFVFYFIPIAKVASRHGARAGYAVALTCAVTWFTATSLAERYATVWMTGWNAAIRLAAFVWIAHLVGRIRELLAAAQQEVQTLRGFLPICAQCKKIRNDKGYWEQIEAYIIQHAPVTFSHGLCEQCAARIHRELAEMRRANEGEARPNNA